MSPLTSKGRKMLDAMADTYKKKGKTAKEIETIFHATVNKRKTPGVEPARGFAQLRPAAK